ncbi:flagellar hook-length control protein FliK [Sphingobium chungangianum]
MNMLSSLKALLFSSASPGVAASQPAVPGETADFAALLNGTMAQEAVASPALPEIDGQGAAAAVPEIPGVEGQDAATTTPALPMNIGQPEATPAHGHVPHGLAIAVAAGKDLPSSLPPGRALGLIKQVADAPVDEQAKVEPAGLPAQAEAGLPNEAPIQPETALPEQPEQPKQVAEPLHLPKPRPDIRKDDAAPEVISPVVQDAPPAPTKSSRKEKAKTELPQQDAVTVAPVPQPVAAAADVPPVASVPAAPEQVSADNPQATAAMSSMTAMAGATPPTPKGRSPLPREPEGIAPDQRAARSEGKVPSAVPDVPVATAGNESPAPELTMAAAPVLNGKPMKAEAIALLQIVREQVAARQTGAPVRVGEQVSAAAHAKADASARPVDTTFDPSILPPPSDTVPAVPAASAPQGATPSLPIASPSPDLSASLGAQVVDMGVSGQWIDGLARDIAGLSANGAQGRFQIDTHHLGAVQVDIRHNMDGAAVSLTVASEAAEMALRQDSDRLKLDAGLAAVRIAEVKVERAPAIAEAHRAETANQSPSQQQQQSQQGSQTSAWAQNSGQNMGQPQGQQNRWQGRENNGFGPKGSGDPAVLNHADAQPAAHDRARARYA